MHLYNLQHCGKYARIFSGNKQHQEGKDQIQAVEHEPPKWRFVKMLAGEPSHWTQTPVLRQQKPKTDPYRLPFICMYTAWSTHSLDPHRHTQTHKAHWWLIGNGELLAEGDPFVSVCDHKLVSHTLMDDITPMHIWAALIELSSIKLKKQKRSETWWEEEARKDGGRSARLMWLYLQV